MQVRRLELLEATVPQLQAALTAGTVTSRDLVSMYLARIDAYDQRGPALNAISVTNGGALAEADARDADRRAGAPRGALHGIPVIIKDNYDTADLQTAAGSRSLAGWVPSDDAFLVKKLREAGAIIIAKSNMHEFAYGITTLGSSGGTVPRSLPISPPWAWAATLAVRSAYRRRTTAWLESAGRRGSPAAVESFRSPAPRTSAGRSREPSPIWRSCSTRQSAMILPTHRPLRAWAISRKATRITCN
jgi:hypothetical protein